MEKNNLLKRKNNACNGSLRKKSKKMNLTKENKIKWKEMSFEEWYDTDIQVFYIWYFIGENKFGVWEGVDQLTQDEADHFNKFIDHYFFLGYPDYNTYSEMSEMEHCFEDGDCYFKCITRNDM